MKAFGLPKSHLLRTSREFNRVYRLGKRLYGKGFVLVALAADQPSSRIGISVQRKVGTAVQRNRIKRLVREAFRLNRDVFPVSSDFVFAVRPGFSPAGMKDVRDAVACVTHNAGKC